MSKPIPQWSANVKGFEAFTEQNLITTGQNIAVPVNPGDPKTLYVLNIGTNYKGHASTTYLKSAAKNLFAVPCDVLVRIAKVVTFYNVIFGDSKKTFSQRAVSWFADVGRILVSPLTWPIIVATELFAAANPSVFSRNAVAKLENALIENNKLDYLKPMTYGTVIEFGACKDIPAPTISTPVQETFMQSTYIPKKSRTGTVNVIKTEKTYTSTIRTAQGPKELGALNNVETSDWIDVLYGKTPRSQKKTTPPSIPLSTPTPTPPLKKSTPVTGTGLQAGGTPEPTPLAKPEADPSATGKGSLKTPQIEPAASPSSSSSSATLPLSSTPSAPKTATQPPQNLSSKQLASHTAEQTAEWLNNAENNW